MQIQKEIHLESFIGIPLAVAILIILLLIYFKL